MVDPKDCLFCRIVNGEIPAKKVYEDGISLAFLDINPRNPGHTLVIPKRHYETIFDIPDGEGGKFFASMKKVAAKVKNSTKAHGLSVCQNNGSAAGQVVGHLHFHLIPRFMNEGPAALEALLPVKKMDEKSLDKIAAVIKGGSEIQEPAEAAEPVEREEPDEVESIDEEDFSEEEPKKPPLKLKKEQKKPEPEKEDDDIDEFEMINFND